MDFLSSGGEINNVTWKGNKLVFYISDVTGHGFDGAIVSSFVKESIDSYLNLRPEEITPGKIVKHLCHQYHLENYPEDYFISFFVGVLDLDNYVLEYTGAGFQESLLVSFENGKDFKLNAKGLPITKAVPIETLVFDVKQMQLNPGATLMVNSDGLTEQENSEGEAFKEDLYDIFFSNSDLPADAIKSIINEKFRNFNDGNLQGADDVTYLIIKLDESKADFEKVFESSFEELEKLDEAYRYLKNYIDKDIYFQGIRELVMNAIEHGNKFDEAKKVFVSLKDLKDKSIVTVEDEGNGFGWRSVLDSNCLDLEGEEERGRGIVMTKLICNNLFYNEKGNKAFLVLDKNV